MHVEVDLGKCTGHGICESLAEDVFEVTAEGSVVIHGSAAADPELLRQAVTQCPAAALRWAD
ncbi:MAG: ferredoxin [Mycolicibacterium cosmeticum]|nr:ferredoxin [Mycolicibacterium cosmeticum]